MSELVLDTWEGQLDLNEDVLLRNRIYATWVRLNDTRGELHKDENFDSQWAQATASGMLRAPYYVYGPQYTARQNFDWLFSNMPAGVKTVAIDVEVRIVGLSPAVYGAELRKFLALVSNYWHIVIYTGAGSLDLLDYWPTNYDYWWAQYPFTFWWDGPDQIWTWEELRLKLAGYDKPFNLSLVPGQLLMWQFTGDCIILPGTTKALDVNLYYGSLTDLQNLFGGTVGIPDPQPDLLLGDEIHWDGQHYQKWESYTLHGRIQYHVQEFDVPKVEFFVSPQRSFRTYVPNMMKDYNLDAAINGDGFVSTTIAGFASSEGKPYGKQGVEETLYISKDNKFTTVKPANLWNAISFPNMLVEAGVKRPITRTRLDVDPRTAFGYNQAGTKFYFITVDGKETYDLSRTGMNYDEVANIGIRLGCWYLFMADGGGSTTNCVRVNGVVYVLNVPCGEEYRSEYDARMRPVANVLGVRAKGGSMGYTVTMYDKPQLWRLKNITGWQASDQNDLDQDGLCFYPGTGSANESNIWLNQAEVDLVRRVNTGVDAVPWERKIQWAVKDQIGYPYYVEPGQDINKAPWKLCGLVIGSALPLTEPDDWNIVKIIGKSSNGYYMIDGIPANADFSKITREAYPWWFHRCNATVPERMVTNDTPVGIFYYALYSPVGRPHSVGDVIGTGMWIHPQCLHSQIVEGDNVPTPTPQTPFPATVIGVPSLFGLKKLNIREGPTLFNPGDVGYIHPNKPIEVLEVVANAEGLFFRIAKGMWLCAYQGSKNRYYIKW